MNSIFQESPLEGREIAVIRQDIIPIIWSDVPDADTVEWIKKNGGLLRMNGDHFRETLLSCGGSEDVMSKFRRFRGRDAAIEPLLERRGLNQLSGNAMSADTLRSAKPKQ